MAEEQDVIILPVIPTPAKVHGVAIDGSYSTTNVDCKDSSQIGILTQDPSEIGFFRRVYCNNCEAKPIEPQKLGVIMDYQQRKTLAAYICTPQGDGQRRCLILRPKTN